MPTFTFAHDENWPFKIIFAMEGTLCSWQILLFVVEAFREFQKFVKVFGLKNFFFFPKNFVFRA